jgi:DNA polymerase-2
VKNQSQFLPLLDAIGAQTKIAIALDGVYRWIAFPPSRRDVRVPVPNRYFGVFQSGEIKVRGIEARRRDTPQWIANTQLKVLSCLSKAGSLDEIPVYLPRACEFVEEEKSKLKAGQIPMKDLIVTQSLSRAIEAYRSPSPAARAAGQLQSAGREVAPGQFMRFIYSRDETGVRAWNLNQEMNPKMVDIKRYCALLERAMGTVLSPFEKESPVLQLL